MQNALRVCVLWTVVVTAAQAQSQWDVTPLSHTKSVPSHLGYLQQLPADSVTGLARSAEKSGVDWRLNLPDGSRLVVSGRQSVTHANGDVTWSGTIQGAGAAYPVLVTEGAQASFGQWTTPRGRFRLEAWGGDAWLVSLDHPLLTEAPMDHGALTSMGDTKSIATSGIESAQAKVGETQIDTLFVYSAGFAARYPGSAGATRVNHLVAVANQIFANSDVALVVRLVGLEAVTYTDAGDNGVALTAMRNSLAGVGVPAAGFEQLRQRRDATGADLVTLVRPHDIETRGSCGIARLFGPGANDGVNVLSDGVDSWSICSDETYAHEVGHNLGAEHQNGANSPNAGFGTAHVVLGQYHTVMGSFGTGKLDRALRLQRFSNPAQLCGGLPCGVTGVSDNARRLRDNMGAVASYRSPRSAVVAIVPAAQDPDEDQDGVPESRDAFPHDARYSADRDRDGTADQADAFPDNPVEQRDTDADGLGDNADPDRDGDGITNAADALPLDASESADIDGDGVGDRADVFDGDRREWGDVDADGVGDNADADTDGDGLFDFAATQSDLLVASIGTDQVLRVDGASGRLIAVEIAERHLPAALGRKSALSFNVYRRRVDGLIASEVRRYDPFSRRREARVLRSFRADDLPGLSSGLSDAMAVGNDGSVFVADGNVNVLQRFDAVNAATRDAGVFGQAEFYTQVPRALDASVPGTLWSLDSGGGLVEIDANSGMVRRRLELLGPGAPALDPVAMAVGPDGQVYVADGLFDRVLRVDVARDGSLQTHVAVGAGGLSRPSAIAFDPQGRMYVSSAGNDRILRYDGATGAFLDVFSQLPVGTLSQPRSLVFVPRVADRYPRDAQRRHRPRVGAWHNPARSGQGIDLQAIPGGLALAWYTYDADGRPTWYLGVGALQGGTWRAPLQRFVWDGQRALGSEVGQVELVFGSEDRAELRWQLGTRTGVEPIEHFQAGRSIETQFPTAVWYAPASPGWGYSVTHQGDVLAVAAFVFDRAGQPTWALGVGNASANELPMLGFRAPQGCPGCGGTTAPSSNAIGTLRFEVHDDVSASGRIQLVDSLVDWRFESLPLRRLSETPTQVDGSARP